jgi:predicted RNA-binding protein with PUA-like domain
MAFWLLKTEPTAYAFADLARERRTRWDGVTNPQAVANLRAMKAGDGAVVYHSGAKEAVGLARVVKAAYPDPGDSTGKLVAVDLAAGKELPSPVGLEALKRAPAFRDSPLLRQGRLSVVPLTAEQWKAVLSLSEAPTRP